MVFVRHEDKPVTGFNVGVVMNKKNTPGLVGLEIEVEGTKLPKQNAPLPWVYHPDGSLRGADNAEYVLNKPIEFEAVPKALEVLWDKFRECGSTLDDSNRTSVHVHLNCQSFFFNRLTTLMGMYFTFEEILTEWCGEHRVGNLFCLRAKDAPAIVSQIKKFIRTDGKTPIHDHHHYAGLNANALGKFGSLEFRSLRGCSDQQTIVDWVSILERMYRLSADFTDPRDFCTMLSSDGPLEMFSNVLGEMAPKVRKDIQMGDQEIRESMYEGIRMAQDLCYCRDWSLFKGVELKTDPFGRDARKLVMNMMDTEINFMDIETFGGLPPAHPTALDPFFTINTQTLHAPATMQVTWDSDTLNEIAEAPQWHDEPEEDE